MGARKRDQEGCSSAGYKMWRRPQGTSDKFRRPGPLHPRSAAQRGCRLDLSSCRRSRRRGRRSRGYFVRADPLSTNHVSELCIGRARLGALRVGDAGSWRTCRCTQRSEGARVCRSRDVRISDLKIAIRSAAAVAALPAWGAPAHGKGGWPPDVSRAGDWRWQGEKVPSVASRTA